MKKSKMLGYIWEVLYKSTDIYEEDLKIIAEDILAKIEAHGMTPPYSKKQDLGCECGCKGRCEIGENWEYE